MTDLVEQRHLYDLCLVIIPESASNDKGETL